VVYCIQLCLFGVTLGIGSCRIFAHRLAEPFFALVPLDVERALGMSLGLTIDKYQVGANNRCK
jgi:hypothetical protein